MNLCMIRGGLDITNSLVKHLKKSFGNIISVHDDFSLFQKIKETHCYIPLSFDEENYHFERSSEKTVKYKLPDGTEIKLEKEIFNAYLDFDLIWSDDISDFFQSINSVDLKAKLQKSIILTGGVSNTKGYKEYLKCKFQNTLPTSAKLKFFSNKEPQFDASMGAFILISMSAMKDLWFKRFEYEDEGVERFYRKIK